MPMHLIRSIPALLLLTLATASGAAAQAATTILIGGAVGTGAMTEAFAPCGGSWGSVQGRLAAERGIFVLEARGGRQVITTRADCTRVPPPDGVHSFRAADVEDGVGLAAEIRGRVRIPSVLLHVGAGAGSLIDESIPYGLVNLGMSTDGSIRISLDVEPTWYRIPVTQIEAEWQQGRLVSTISSESGHEWERSVVFRMSVAVPIN